MRRCKLVSKYKYDELSVNNGKIILTIFSCVSIIMACVNSTNFNSFLITCTTYYLSNLLTFYSINPKSKAGAIRRVKIVNLYICLCATLFICFMLYTSLDFMLVKVALFWILKFIVFATSFIAPIYAIKDDDDYKPKDVAEVKKKTKKKIHEEREKKLFSKRDKDVKMNSETKDFIKATDRKGTVEGRKR